MLSSLLGIIYRTLLKPVIWIVGIFFLVVFLFCLAFIVYCRLKYRVRRLRATEDELLRMRLYLKPADFIRWKLIDRIRAPALVRKFREFGLTLFCGRQGAGKSISMVQYIRKMKRLYPKCIIVANFDCDVVDRQMKSWHDLLKIRNGEDGVIFAIDEIHSEYSAASWKDFPEDLLSEISQQRKQRIKIVATSQIFTRVVKQLREQAFSVIICRTLAGRWTFCREYDAKDYEAYCDNPLAMRKKIKSLRKYSFIQSDDLRNSYDTYAKIERMAKTKFIPRGERG